MTLAVAQPADAAIIPLTKGSRQIATGVLNSVLSLYDQSKDYAPLAVQELLGGVETRAVDVAIVTLKKVGYTAEDASSLLTKLDSAADEVVEQSLQTKEAVEQAVVQRVDAAKKAVAKVNDDVEGWGNQIIDSSEGLVDTWLPSDGESETEEGASLSDPATAEEKTAELVVISNKELRARLTGISGTITRRLQRKAIKGLDHLRLRSKELTHVDLIEYAEMYLDTTSKTIVGAKANLDDILASTSKQVEERYNEQIAPAVTKIAAELEERVVTPAKTFLDAAVVSFIANKESVEEYTNALRTRAGKTWSENLVKPAHDIFAVCKSEWANIRDAAVVKGATPEEEEELKLDLLVKAVGERLHLAWSKVIKSWAAATLDVNGEEAKKAI